MRWPIRRCVSVSPILDKRYSRRNSRHRRRLAHFKSPRSRNGGRSSRRLGSSLNKVPDTRLVVAVKIVRRRQKESARLASKAAGFSESAKLSRRALPWFRYFIPRCTAEARARAQYELAQQAVTRVFREKPPGLYGGRPGEITVAVGP